MDIERFFDVEKVLDVVEKTDASPEQGKKLRIFLVATMYSTEHYDTWVDMGCPSFEREEIDVVAEQKEYERKEKEKEDAENAKYPEGYVRFENNPEMERIWNLYPSYEAAMTDPERNRYSKPEFMNEFLQVVYDEMDPEAQIEEEYKTKNDTMYRWKAFRLIRQWNFAAFRKMKNNDLETIVPEILGLDPPKGWKPHNPVDFRDVPIEMPDTIDGEKVDKSSHHELTEEEIDKIIEKKLRFSNFVIKLFAYFSGTLFGPVISFFKKNGFAIATGILGFVFLFKVGEAFLGRMSIVFYKEIGFSKGQIAIYSKGLGWITTVVFTLLGGVMAMRAGTIKTMFFAGGLMALTNLLFAVLAWTGKSELLFAIAVIADDITAAFATVAFVAFISLLVDRTYTATQYALLASIGTAGRTTLASSSGALVDWLNGDWGTFFVLTTIMVIPSLICLWFIRNKIKIGAK